MRVSVIVPAYNCAAILPDCIESILRQGQAAMEVLVVDDGSTDNTAEVAAKFEDIRVIRRSERGGAGAARVSGVKAARGDVVAFIDADCTAPVDWLDRITNSFEEDEELGAVGGMYRHCGANNVVAAFGKFEEEFLHHNFAKNPYSSTLTGGNMAVRKVVWNQARSGRELIHFRNVASSEDTVVANEIRTFSKTKFDPEIFVYHSPKSKFSGLIRRNITRARTRMLSNLHHLSHRGDNLFAAFGGFRLFWAAACLWAALISLMSLAVTRDFLYWQIGIPVAFMLLHYVLSDVFFRFIATNSERPCPVEVGPVLNVSLRCLVAIRAASWVLGTLYGTIQYGWERIRYYGRVIASILHFWNPGKISKMFYFVTSKCNARCEFCFNLENVVNWKDRQPLELTVNEVTQMARKFGRLPYLTLSGGEPFARVDLALVIKAFYDNSKTMWVTIPTNGALTTRVVEGVSDILITCPNIFLTIQFSIDSLHAAHDDSRKIKGGFEAMLKTAQRLSDLRRHFPNLRVQINTPYDTFNLEDIENIREYCKANIDFDQQLFYLFREEGELISDKNAHLADDFLEFIQAHDFAEWRERGRSLWGRAVRALQAVTYSDTRRIKKDKEFIRTCYATRKFVTLYDDGSFSPCEVLEGTKLGNIRDFEFDYYKLRVANNVDAYYRKEIVDAKCNCEWMCAPAINMLYDPSTYMQIARNLYRPGRETTSEIEKGTNIKAEELDRSI